LYLICSTGFKQNSYDFFGREVEQTTTDDTDDADREVIPGESPASSRLPRSRREGTQKIYSLSVISVTVMGSGERAGKRASFKSVVSLPESICVNRGGGNLWMITLRRGKTDLDWRIWFLRIHD
jgi:hypothetical protein